MLFLLLANCIVLLHALFIVFAIIGGFIALRWPKLVLLHLPALSWGIWIEVSHGICPLTSLEKHFRHLANSHGYDQGFIEYYLLPIIYPAQLTDHLQYLLALGLALINIVAYCLWIRTHWRPQTN